MVLFNYSTKEITAKIVYYGPGLCGKTTNLQYIYDSLPQTINKGKMLSLATKTDRTLFFDFLPIDLGTIRGMRTRLQLYTVPGQVFYNTTRKLVLKGADGVVFVADSQKRMLDANLESLGNLEENLAEHDMKLTDIPMILQFNKRDLPDVASMEELNAAMNKFNAPIYEAVAPTGIGVHETLKAITRLVLNSLKERYADKREQKTDAQAKASAAMAAFSNKTSAAEVRAPKPAATPMPEMTFKSTSEPPAPRPMDQAFPDSHVTASAPSAAPKPMAAPMASNPPMTHSKGDSEPLGVELPEMDELGESGAMPAGSSDISEIMMPSGSGIGPDLMSDDPSPTALMPAISDDLGVEDDLLELAPESELAIDAGGDDLLELADEPLADLAHLEDSIAMPVLDVTSEMAFEESAEPMTPTLEPGISDMSMTASTSTPDEFESTAIDNSAQLESMLRHDSPIQSPGVEDGFDEAFFEPIETGTVVAEDHHDTSLHVTDMNPSSIAPIPLALESETHREESGAFEASITPRIPVSDLASRPMGAADIARTPGMASEINLPVKLEIGGRCISFELKISLDLTEISAHAVSDSKEMNGARS